MYLGKQQLGTWLDCYLQCKNATGTPLMPSAVPTIKITDSLGVTVLNQKMPLVDKVSQVGLFCSRIFLGLGFSVGSNSIRMVYTVSGQTFIVDRTFEICAAGDSRGQVLSMIYAHFPQADYVVFSTERGEISRGKNPRIS